MAFCPHMRGCSRLRTQLRKLVTWCAGPKDEFPITLLKAALVSMRENGFATNVKEVVTLPG